MGRHTVSPVLKFPPFRTDEAVVRAFSPAPSLVPKGTVLIVEDDRIARRHAVALLQKDGHQTLEADGAVRAQDILTDPGSPPIDCVLTDYNMPGMNGLDLLQWINRQVDAPAVLVATSAAEREILEVSLRRGACDFLEKPLSLKPLQQAVNKAIQMTAKKREVAGMESAVRKVGDRQRRLLGGVKGHSLTYFQRAPHTVGGDFIGVYQTGPERELTLLTDIAGHDLEAGFASSYFQGLLRGMLAAGRPVPEILSLFNRILLDEWDQKASSSNLAVPISIDLCAIEIDRRTNRLSVWRCGSPLPIYSDGSGQARTLCYGGSNPLGWFPGTAFLLEEVELEEDSIVQFWTDGLEDLSARLNLSPLSIGYRLMAEGPDFDPDWLHLATDDILVARLDAGKVSGSGTSYCPILSNVYRPEDAVRIDEIQAYWERSLAVALPNLADERTTDILLCLREAVLNAVLHGCQANEFARCTLSYSVGRQNLRAYVQDPGPGHDFVTTIHEGPEPMEGHRGLLLIHSLTDKVSIAGRGASLTMEWTLGPNQQRDMYAQ